MRRAWSKHVSLAFAAADRSVRSCLRGQLTALDLHVGRALLNACISQASTEQAAAAAETLRMCRRRTVRARPHHSS